MSYRFERVLSTEAQIKTLYELLKSRNYVISHKGLPNFDEHRQFVKNHPYLHWFLVCDGSNYCGSFYLKRDNSIGLNLVDYNIETLSACVGFIKNNFSPQVSEPSMITEYFYLNVSWSNEEALNSLQELGLKPLQISLRLDI